MKIKQLQLPLQQLSQRFRACWLYGTSLNSWWLEWAKIVVREQLSGEFSFEKITTSNKSLEVLAASLNNLSLLEATKRAVIYEYTGTLDAAWAKALTQLISTLTEDQFLIIVTNKLEASQRRAKWCLALENLAPLLVVPIWTLEGGELASWLNLELRRRNLVFTKEAASFLLQYTNEDPASIWQILMKLQLLGRDKWSIEAIRQFLEAGSFNLKMLIYALLRRDAAKSLSLLDLAATCEEPLAVLNGIIKELRLLIKLQTTRASGQAFLDILKDNGVWFEHRQLILAHWQQVNLTKLRQLLAAGEKLSRLAKSSSNSIIWQHLHWWCLRLAAL